MSALFIGLKYVGLKDVSLKDVSLKDVIVPAKIYHFSSEIIFGQLL